MYLERQMVYFIEREKMAFMCTSVKGEDSEKIVLINCFDKTNRNTEQVVYVSSLQVKPGVVLEIANTSLCVWYKGKYDKSFDMHMAK